MKGLSYNTIKRILKENVKCEVSKEFVLNVKSYLDLILIEIALETKRNLDETNYYRGIQGLPKRKRIDPSTFKRLSIKHYKDTSEFESKGEAGQPNRDTVLSKGR